MLEDSDHETESCLGRGWIDTGWRGDNQNTYSVISYNFWLRQELKKC